MTIDDSHPVSLRCSGCFVIRSRSFISIGWPSVDRPNAAISTSSVTPSSWAAAVRSGGPWLDRPCSLQRFFCYAKLFSRSS